MTLWIQRPRGIGAWAALAVFVFDLTYIATGMVWLISEGDPVRRQSLTPADPHLAILEAIIVAICPLMGHHHGVSACPRRARINELQPCGARLYGPSCRRDL